ncbi:olfactory receptor 14J1-like [Notechis scutatus]|uniref:Olfactory receptor n=1 Tax=Notechis scutatus TaxID=8663 RepID=A0A6J1VUI8_9SAUR|nr:olfactory receptor 14J1-like [Notechis scutatus]
MHNQSTNYYFLLMEFSEVQEQQLLYFFVFLVIYFAILTGNFLIIFAIIFNHQLHTPMYFFLLNLAIQDLLAISVILPKSMANILMNTRHISYFGCICQVFFLVFFLGSDLWLLTVMAYDRYIAICNPLQYEKIMNKQACIYMIFAVWISSLFNGLLNASFVFGTPFCSNIINQFFCEIPKLLKLSCTGLNKNEIKVLMVMSALGSVCFFFILYTYVCIFTAVLKIHSLEGRKKAVSTCLPHVIVVSIFLFSGFFAYLKTSSTSLDFISTLLYCIIPPFLNPIIYSMRNRDIKIALAKVLNIRKTYKKISNLKCISG